MGVLEPQDVGLILTYLCQAGCAHCVYACGPRRGAESMDRATLAQALDVIAALPGPPRVHLTGGEPFLVYPLLLEAVRAATQRGIGVYVETNAGWCVSETEAMMKFSALRAAGLWGVLISCSPFQAEHVPPQRVLIAARAAQALWGPRRVLLYQAQYLESLLLLGAQSPIPLERYLENHRGDQLWHSYGVIGGGRAGYALERLAPRLPAEAFQGETCADELLRSPHSHFDLYGNFIPAFCGGIALGSWRDWPDLVLRVQRGELAEPLLRLLHEGPYGLALWAARVHGYLWRCFYADKCHLCVDVRRHLAACGLYPDVLRPAEFYTTLETEFPFGA